MVRYCSLETTQRERERRGEEEKGPFFLSGDSWGGVGLEMMKKDGE